MKIYTLAATLSLSIVCYGQAGSLNTQFNGAILAASFGPSHSIAEDIAVQPDGKIVVAGHTIVNGVSNMAIVRLNPSGTLDNSFGTGGKVVINIHPSGSWLQAVALQNDGKIVVGGSCGNSSQVNFAILRFLTNGNPDPGFGTNGVVTANVDTYSYLKDLLIQGDGKIIVAGEAADVASSDYAVARFLSNGSPDATFSGGSVIINILGGDYVKTIKQLSGGKYIIGGSSSFQFSMVKLNANGTLDENFGNSGKVTTIVGGIPGNDNCLAIDLQADGKIIAVGEGSNAGTLSDVAVLRYTINGQLDNSFANNGVYLADFNGSFDQASAVAVLTNGKIVIGGNTNVAGHPQVFVARLTQTGNLDPSFGNGGQTTVAVGNEAYAYAMALKGLNIYIAGVEKNVPNKMMAVAFNNDVGPLPVRFSSFTVQKEGSRVLLKWQTEFEEQTKSFIAEKSNDGSSFTTLAEVAATGNSNSTREYRAIDEKPFPDITYYRVRAVDLDGSFSYTKILYVKNEGKVIEVAPNPAGSFSQVQFPGGIKGLVKIELFDMSGRMLKSSNVQMDGNPLSFAINMSELKAGSYVLKLNGAALNFSQQLIKE